MEGAEVCLGGWRGCWGFTRLLVLLPRRLLALGAAKVAGFAQCTSFRRGGLTDVALHGNLIDLEYLHLNFSRTISSSCSLMNL